MPAIVIDSSRASPAPIGASPIGAPPIGAASFAAETAPARALFAHWPTGSGTSHYKPSPRRATERLAAELAGSMLWPRSTIIDVGCRASGLAGRWLAEDHRVIGTASDRDLLDSLDEADLHPAFTLVRGDADTIDMPAGSADLVTAFDVVQYADDPAASIARFADWVRPGGAVCVQVDSLLAAHAEMIRDGRETEADRMLVTRRSRVANGACGAETHLFTAAALRDAFRAAGLVDVEVRGLVIGASLWGRIGVAARMRHNEEEYLALERSFWKEPALADQGLHLFAMGRRPRGSVDAW